MTNTEALRFLLDNPGTQHSAVIEDARAELRRLHALNAELVEALRLADLMLSGAHMDAKVVERKVREALAKVEASK